MDNLRTNFSESDNLDKIADKIIDPLLSYAKTVKNVQTPEKAKKLINDILDSIS